MALQRTAKPLTQSAFPLKEAFASLAKFQAHLLEQPPKETQ
ncbi:MAG: hypothetical protein ACJAT5_000750 [Lentimonas sp.]